MSLQKKISEEQAKIAYRILHEAGKKHDDSKLRKLVEAWKHFDVLQKEVTILEKKIAEEKAAEVETS